MAWRTAATVMIVVFVATIIWAVTAGPLNAVGNEFQEVAPDDSAINADGKIDSAIDGYFNLFIVLIGGVLLWGTWRVFRQETTRRGGGL